MATNHTAPIGVFDSGLGGLTVLKSLCEVLPAESFIYLGDVARLPYGNKSARVVNAYSMDCVRFLKEQGVKLVVVACNTATALSLEMLRRETSLPVVGVIKGGVRAAMEVTRNNRVAVLATESTVRNEAYLREFDAQGFTGMVRQIACPLLVPLAEEGWWESEITVEVIRHYVDRLHALECDTVVLGCTHYPLLEPSFRKVLADGVVTVHGGRVLAGEVKEILNREHMAATRAEGIASGAGRVKFFSTDAVSPNLPLLQLSNTFGTISFEQVTL